MKRKLLTVALFTLLLPPAFSQEGMRLTDCLVFGLANNPAIQKAALDTEKSEVRISEVYSGYMPQVKANASLNDNLRLQTSILPGEIFGQPGQLVPVQFGTQYNITAGIDATQVIFEPAIFSGVKMANQSLEISRLNQEITEEQLMFNIAQAYYGAQITATQMDIISVNLLNLDTLERITKLKYENDMVLKSDYDRVVINRVNLQTEINTLQINYDKQLRVLKYYMGMPLDSAVSIDPATDEAQKFEAPEFSASNTNNMRMLQLQNELYTTNISQVRSGYMPSLSLSFRYAYMAMQNDLDVFGSNSQWYPMSYLTLNLQVPIFDGFTKARKVQQLEIDIMKNELEQQDTELYMDLQYQNALNDLKVSQSSLEIQRLNIELAQELYRVSKLRYEQGIERTALSDLLNAEMSLKEAQANYMRALVQIKVSQLDLLKATGNIQLITQ